jgi:hypothetical protein
MDKLWVYVAIGHRFKYLYSPFVLVLMITADEVPDPSETALSSVSEHAVSSVGTSEDAGEASSTCRQVYWETLVPSATVAGPSATTVDEISANSEIPDVAFATPEVASRLVTGSE